MRRTDNVDTVYPYYGRSFDIYGFGTIYFCVATGRQQYRDDSQCYFEYEGKIRDRWFADLKLNKDLTKVLKDCLIEQDNENNPKKSKRPKVEDLMYKYGFYKGIDWLALFNQDLDLGQIYAKSDKKVDFKKWFEKIAPMGEKFNKPKEVIQ